MADASPTLAGPVGASRVISADATVERWLQINGLTGVPRCRGMWRWTRATAGQAQSSCTTGRRRCTGGDSTAQVTLRPAPGCSLRPTVSPVRRTAMWSSRRSAGPSSPPSCLTEGERSVLSGSLIPGISAMPQRSLPTMSAAPTVGRSHTALGGLCFLIGAVLLVPEARRASPQAPVADPVQPGWLWERPCGNPRCIRRAPCGRHR